MGELFESVEKSRGFDFACSAALPVAGAVDKSGLDRAAFCCCCGPKWSDVLEVEDDEASSSSVLFVQLEETGETPTDGAMVAEQQTEE